MADRLWDEGRGVSDLAQTRGQEIFKLHEQILPENCKSRDYFWALLAIHKRPRHMGLLGGKYASF